MVISTRVLEPEDTSLVAFTEAPPTEHLFLYGLIIPRTDVRVNGEIELDCVKLSGAEKSIIEVRVSSTRVGYV